MDYLVYNVWSEPDDVAAEDFRHFRLFAAFAQPDVVDESAVATSGVDLKVK